ncbi:MAG: hypothetical protein HY722_15410 [Planctomycetes bacterium]|nr:hypothetical protein [Planctomycetota bacterium]
MDVKLALFIFSALVNVGFIGAQIFARFVYKKTKAEVIDSAVMSLSIILVLALAGAAIVFNGDVEDLKTQLGVANQEAGKLKQRLQASQREVDELRRLVDSNGAQAKDRGAIHEDYFLPTQQLLFDVWNSADGELRKTLEAVEEKGDKITQPPEPGKMDQYNDFFSMYKDLRLSVTALRNAYLQTHAMWLELDKKLNLEREDARGKKNELTRRIDEITSQKEGEISRLQTDKQGLITQTNDLTDEVGRLKRQVVQKERDFNLREARLLSKINELKEKIDDIVKKEERTLASTQPDGEVVYSDNKIGFAWIDLGKKHGIRKGMVFEVVQFVKGGRQATKGRVEVKSVDTDKAQVAILETVDASDPIVRGDYIKSPFFDKSEQQVFVFAGELTNTTYGRRELVRKIEEIGARVDDEVTIETDYLIVGKGYKDVEAYQQAVPLGVYIMRENELFDYLSR